MLVNRSLKTVQEKAMAPHSSTLAWKIPWTEEPGGLQSIGSLGVGHDWATSLSLFTFMHWRRKWQPTPVFLPGESQGQRSLVGCRLWGSTETDTTEATWQQQQQLLSVLCSGICSPINGSLPAVLWAYGKTDLRQKSQTLHHLVIQENPQNFKRQKFLI